MKVLFVSNLYPPNIIGGYERLCADVAGACADAGLEVVVLTSCYGHTVSRHPRQTVHQALQLQVGETVYRPFAGSPAQRRARGVTNVTALRRIVAESQPDRIFCWNLFGLDPDFLEALIGCGVPLVFMLTDNWLAALFKADFVQWYLDAEVFAKCQSRRPSDSGPIHFPGTAIFGSAYMKRFYDEAGMSFMQSRIIHNGVRQRIPVDAVVPDRRRTVQPETFNLLFAGRIVSLKGLHTVIEAMPLLQGPHPVRLTIIGNELDDAYSAEIHDLIARLGVRSMIQFRQSVSEHALWELFQNYDAYVFPSLYEPFSLTLIHALAAGVPTVASAVGGNTEIISEGETGLLFRSGDPIDLARAVRSLMDEPELRQTLSARAQAVSADFTFERMVGRMQEVLLE